MARAASMEMFIMQPRIILAASVLLAASASAAAEARCVDINAAPPEELMRIVHIDGVRSAEAVELRARRPFADVRDLTRIRGIGPSRVIDIEAQALACVGRDTPAGSRPEITGRARIIDGDTLDIADERIRLSASMPPKTARFASMTPSSGHAETWQLPPWNPSPKELWSGARCMDVTAISAP